MQIYKKLVNNFFYDLIKINYSMHICFKKIENLYLNIFIFKPKIISTILFIPFLYLIGWILAKPISIFSPNNQNISLIGTIITFSIFIISLPKWFKMRWGLLNTWALVGVKKNDKRRNLSFYFFKGILYSLFLLLVILIPILDNNSGNWQGNISVNIFINAIILMLGIGFAEELIFRGWLFEELKNLYGFKKALIFQALVYSIVHIGFDMPFWQMISILFGLFLLGILLSLMRIKDNNSIWGCAGLHGGLVGIWFLMNNGLMEISKNSPIWLVGPGNINTNPLGGLWGISLLFFLCFLYFFILKKKSKI